jgi:hypothetical protein
MIGRAMLATDLRAAATTWRPQLFGDRRAQEIDDPLVEPLWTGPRVLAMVVDGEAALIDVEGQPMTGHNEVRAALVDASAGSTFLLEASLTPEPLQALLDIAARDAPTLPKPGDALTQMMVGSRGDRKDRLFERVDEARRRADEFAVDVALVAVDLLWLDDESLCDVPLLERKRILESVVAESYLIRVGTYVKPPIDAWLGAWRSFGFHRAAFKAANSRYVPGAKNRDWALAEIPRR